MSSLRKTTIPLLTLALLPLSISACKSEKKGEAVTETKSVSAPTKGANSAAAPGPAATPKTAVAPGDIAFETVKAPLLGEMQLPKGAKPSGMTDGAGHYKFPVSADGMDNIYVDYEITSGAGAATLKKAEALANVVTFGTMVASETLESGIHLVEKVRESDKKIFVVAFRPDGYVKCWAASDYLEQCKVISKSVPMPTK